MPHCYWNSPAILDHTCSVTSHTAKGTFPPLILANWDRYSIPRGMQGWVDYYDCTHTHTRWYWSTRNIVIVQPSRFNFLPVLFSVSCMAKQQSCTTNLWRSSLLQTVCSPRLAARWSQTINFPTAVKVIWPCQRDILPDASSAFGVVAMRWLFWKN